MPLRDVFLVFLVMLIWAFNWVLIKVGLHSFPPFLFCALRFFVSAFPWVFIVGFERKRWREMVLFALVLGVLHFSLMLWAVQLGMPAGLTSLVYQVQVFLTILVASLAFGDKISRRSWVGMLVSFIGIAMIGSQVQASLGWTSLGGFLCTLGAAMMFALNSLLVRKFKPQNMVKHLVNIFVYATPPMLALSWVFEGGETMKNAVLHLDRIGIFVLLYSGIFSTIVAFALWGYLLKKHKPEKVVPYSFLVPVFSLFFASILLDEKLNSAKLFASGFIIAGLVISNFPWNRKQKVLPTVN